MRLLFVGSSRGRRGTETHLIALARAMRRRGHPVAALVPGESFLADALTAAGVTVIPGGFRNALDPRGFGRLLAASRPKPEWIVGAFGHEYWPLVAGARVVGARVALFRHLPGRRAFWTRRLLPRAADRFIAVSEFLREKLISEGAPPERIQFLPNPIELSEFAVSPALRSTRRAALGLPEDAVVAGYAGAFAEVKGIVPLVAALEAAMAQVPRLHALWVGPEDQAGAIRARLSAGVRARHHFRPWTAAMVEEYAAMDLLVVPSLWEEVLGRVAVEAHAAGLPVVASRVGGLPEVVEDGVSGRLVERGDVARLGGAILELVAAGAEGRARLGEQGRRRVSERFEAGQVAARFEELLASETYST